MDKKGTFREDLEDEETGGRPTMLEDSNFSPESNVEDVAQSSSVLFPVSSANTNHYDDDFQINCLPSNHNSSDLIRSTSPLNISPSLHLERSLPHQQSEEPKIEVHLYKRRWLMAFLFAAYSMSNAYQWIHLNIVGDKVVIYYNSSLPDSKYMQQVSLDWLSMVYMLAYIPLIFPLTWLLDKKGLQVVVVTGAFLNAVGAWLKCAALHPDRFALIVFAQTVCAIAQVFILGIPACLAAVWFGPNEVSTATAIGVFGNQIGCALGFVLPTEIVTDAVDVDAIGKQLKVMLYGGAVVTSTLFVLILIFFRNRPPSPPSQAQMLAANVTSDEDYCSSLRNLFTNTSFILLLITYGINTGSYYAIGTLLNSVILYYFHEDDLNAGRIGLTLVLAGVFGSILSGIWLDRTKRYKLTTVVIYVLSSVGMLCFTLTLGLNRIWIVFLCSGFLGFFMTGYLPVGFEFAAELTYPESEGTSSGLLNASAQIFGIILTLGIRTMMLHLQNGMLAGNLAISSVLLLGVVGTILIRSDLRRQAAQQTKLSEALIEEEILSNGKTENHVVGRTDTNDASTI